MRLGRAAIRDAEERFAFGDEDTIALGLGAVRESRR